MHCCSLYLHSLTVCGEITALYDTRNCTCMFQLIPDWNLKEGSCRVRLCKCAELRVISWRCRTSKDHLCHTLVLALLNSDLPSSAWETEFDSTQVLQLLCCFSLSLFGLHEL